MDYVQRGEDVMNTIILLICVLSNLLFAFGGYMAGRKIQIIELHKGDVLQNATAKYEDEAASWLTPEQEIAYAEALAKKGDVNDV
jgi:hypothetical protein